MTINEENKIDARIIHPRLFGGRSVALNLINFARQVENDINYIPKGKNPDPIDYFRGPETLAADMMKINDTFTPSARIKTRSSSGGTAALSADLVIEEPNKTFNSAEISHANNDEEELDISNVGFDSYLHFGATKIKEGSTVVKDSSGTTLVEGTEYEIDHHRGRIKFLSGQGLTDDQYTIGYVFKNTARNIVNSLAKIPKFGGATIFTFGIDDSYTGEVSGLNYTVFVNAVDVSLEPQQPDEAEVEFDLRQAKRATA